MSENFGNILRAKFAEHGLMFIKAHKHDAEFGYDEIHKAVRMTAEWDEPDFAVFNTCPFVKKNFLNFCYATWATGRMDDIKGPKKGYNPKDDDFIDMIRYMYQNRLTYSGLKNMAKVMSYDETEEERSGSNVVQLYERDGTRTGYGGRSLFG